MKNIIDAHYFLLPSQGNVYSLKQICTSNGNKKVLTASLRRKVFSLEYTTDASSFLKPCVREVLFTYIPSGAEIISIDIFNKSLSSDDFVIGIAIIKSSSEQNTEMYLNIYSEWEPSSEFNLESVAQNCLILELNFIPYQLYHTWLPECDLETKEVVWLLAGSDMKIHMFREDRHNHCYTEVNTSEHFTELVDLPSIVLWMDIYHCKHSSRRISALGCKSGYVRLAVVDGKNSVISTHTAQFEGPVTSVSLFTLRTNIRRPSFVDHDSPSESNEEQAVHLLVSNSLQPSVVYMDVMKEGLKKPLILSGSEQFDAVLCACIADVNMDGQNEIMLGTYGQEILLYKYVITDDSAEGWTLESQRSFATPIYSILYMDITGDGVREFIVLTLRGVHILQHDPKEIDEILSEKIKKLNLKLKCDDNLVTS